MDQESRINAVIGFFSNPVVPISATVLPTLERRGVRLLVQEEYRLHSEVSGNKWRKLKYNLLAAARAGADTLVTMGGAYSNHLAAVAAAGARFGFRTIGYVRGEQVLPLNPTLRYCERQKMQLHFVSRPAFRELRDTSPIRQHTGTYWLPEGGTNELAVRGCTEMWQQWTDQQPPDVAAICAGTGGAAAGLIRGAPAGVRVEVYAALKGNFLKEEINDLIDGPTSTDWALITDYHCGGYAKTTPALLDFMRTFRRQTGLPVDPIYTGKLFYGLLHRIEAGAYPRGTTILAFHTGGLQGIAGFEARTGQRLR